MTEEQCGEGCSCGSGGGCGCGSCGPADFYDAMERKLMDMVFYSHKSILFDKIRERIEKEEGPRLDKIADLVVETARTEFKNEQELDAKRAELREKMKEVFDE